MALWDAELISDLDLYGIPVHPCVSFLNVYDLSEAYIYALQLWSPALGEVTYLNVGMPKKQLDVSRLAKLGWSARLPVSEGSRRKTTLFLKALSRQLLRL